MAAIDPALQRAPATLSFQQVLLTLAVLAAVRLIGLHYSVVDLFFDEAQYWAWSRELAFGYFSKPPLLAWIIAAADPVCGTGEACVRAASPLIYFGTCLIVYAVAEELYDQPTAAWSALALAFGAGLAFSARIISTDVPLLFFWTLALLAYVKLLRTPDWRWTVVLGVALGFGMLSKYAMIYFALCAGCAALIDRDARILLMRPPILLALGLAAIILAPNIHWNVANDFLTVRHTGDNITGDGLRLRPFEPLAFLGSQFAVAGPFVFATFLFILSRLGGSQIRAEDRLLLAFAIPPLALIAALSLLRPANANWAAPGLISMTILAVAWWQRSGSRRWLWATLSVGIVLQAILMAGDANAYRITLPVLGRNADVYQRTLGWHSLGIEAADRARAAHAPTVVAEGRPELAALIYYLRHERVTALAWPIDTAPRHHFDLTRSLDRFAAEPVLLITPCPHPARLQRYYSEVTRLAPIIVATGPSSARSYHAYKLDKRHRDIGPLGRCAEAAP